MKHIKILYVVLILLSPNLLFSDSSAKTLLLERSARVLASYLGSFNPNENLFHGINGISPLYPKDLFERNIKIDINEKHSIFEPLREKTVTVQGMGELSEFFEKRKLKITISTLGACAGNCCNYPTLHGISHNHVYLHEACFVFKDSRSYLKSMLLYNGD